MSWGLLTLTLFLAQTPPEEVPASDLTKLPELQEFVQAKYPERAEKERVEAEVILDIDIAAEGTVQGVQVAKPAEPQGYGFDDAAVDAAFQFVFTPAEAEGQPVPVRITYRYVFTLEAEPPPSDKKPPKKRDPVANFVGRLLERGTRIPMAAVTVTVFRGEGDDAVGYEAISDDKGQFVFYDLQPGTWKVLVDTPGYFPLRTREELSKNEKLDVTYYIERASYNPFDVLVTAPKPRKEVSRTTLTIEEIDKVPGTFGDPLAVVQNLPSVARAPTGSGLVIARGAAPEDTGVFVNGIQVPIIYHFGGLRSVIPTGMLEAIDFYPGNYGTRYGRQTGGILDVRLKRLNPDGVHGYVDVSVLDTGVYLEAPITDELSIAVAGRRSYVDFILNAVIPDDAPIFFVTAPRYYDYQLLASWRPTATHEVRAFVYGSDDRLELIFNNPGNLDLQIEDNNLGTSTRFYRANLESTWTPNERFQNNASLGVGKNWLELGLGDQFEFDIDFLVAQLRESASYKFSDTVRLTAGLDYIYSISNGRILLPRPPKEGDPGFAGDPTDVLLAEFVDEVYHAPAVYLDAELSLLEGWLLVPGFRADYFSRTGAWGLEPRFTTRYQINAQWTAKGGVGLFHQEASFDETDEAFGSPNLGLERAVHYSAGAEYRPLEYLTIDTTFFYKDMDNLVARTNETLQRNGETVPLNYDNEGEGRVYGAEILVRHEFANNFFGWIAYTVSRSERREPPDKDYRLFDFDQTHILTVVGSYRLPANWEIGGRWRLVSGNPFTPVTGSVFDSDTDEYEPVFGRVNSDRLEPFHQLDVRVDKRWIYNTWTLGAYLDVQNIYNRANAEDVSYNYDFTRSARQQGLPIITILGLRAEF